MPSNLALTCADGQLRQETFGGFSGVLDRYAQPQNYDRTGANLIKIESILGRSRTGNKYPVWKFCLKNVPLSALVQFEDGHWFAELEWLNVIGEGSSPQEALADLEIHIDYFIGFYEHKSHDELTPFASELKNRFAKLVRS